MTLSPDIREKVRRRARFGCEFCGVTETDSGGELTTDHFRPRSKGGDDSPDNLIYCCAGSVLHLDISSGDTLLNSAFFPDGLI